MDNKLFSYDEKNDRYVIPKNDYVPPKADEVRPDVVLGVLEYLISHISKSSEGETTFPVMGEKHYNSLYATINKETNKVVRFNYYQYTGDDYENIRVSGHEMKRVFKVLQDNNYYIYPINNETEIVISKRPYRGNTKAKYQKFDYFID